MVISDPVEPGFAFTGVTVVDVQTGHLVPDQTVIIEGNRVVTVQATKHAKVPNGTRTIDARSKYLIPGLWDMHVHVDGYPEKFYPLFLAYGVTGVREMFQRLPIDSFLHWRKDISGGRLRGPRIVGSGGAVLGGSAPQWGANFGNYASILVTTPAEARAAVDSLRAAGADHIKVYEKLERESYFAILEEGRRIGMPVVGHLPASVSLLEASDSGQRSLEHISELHYTCGRRTSAATCPSDTVFAAFARNQTWVVPTLITFYYIPDRGYQDRMSYWPDSVRASQYFVKYDRWTTGYSDSLLLEYQQITRRLHRAGVPLLAGTDANSRLAQVVAGFSLHEELDLLVGAGLTPLEALQTATINPAKYLNATDSLGTIAPGMLADLVLLDADPLIDIRNTKKINAVVANGRYFDRRGLDMLLATVQRPPR